MRKKLRKGGGNETWGRMGGREGGSEEEEMKVEGGGIEFAVKKLQASV